MRCQEYIKQLKEIVLGLDGQLHQTETVKFIEIGEKRLRLPHELFGEILANKILIVWFKGFNILLFIDLRVKIKLIEYFDPIEVLFILFIGEMRVAIGLVPLQDSLADESKLGIKTPTG